MKKIVMVMIALLLAVPTVMAQGNDKNHGELGVFANYFRLDATSTNFVGVGGRAGFNVHPNIQFEAEMAYDFERNVSTDLPLPGGTPNTFVKSPLRLVHGLFGPKFQVGTGAARFFVTAKGGFLNFSSSPVFSTQISNVPNGETEGVFYPGAGVEVYAGPIGLRIEAGDEMYFSNGTHNNIRIAAGPQIRF